MNLSALLFMTISQGIITILTVYFFIRVVVKKPGEGSFCKDHPHNSSDIR